MDLSPTHLHLLLNHFPTIGFMIGIALYVASLFGGTHHHLKQAALTIMVGVAIVTIPTYTTGNAAQFAIQESREVSRALIDMHEGAALVALMAMQITGLCAWLALWHLRRLTRVPGWLSAVVLGLAAITFALVARAAGLGGEIRHVEIRVTEEALTEQFGRTIGNFVRETPWAWVASEAVHFVGLSLVIGVVVLIDLRMLGVIRGVSYRTLDRLLPWAILGFALNVVTGMLFFAASPGQYTGNVAFYWKLGFLMLACANTLYFTFDDTFARDADAAAPLASKTLAMTALALWIGVMFWGSMLPFIGNAF